LISLDFALALAFFVKCNYKDGDRILMYNDDYTSFTCCTRFWSADLQRWFFRCL